MAYLVAGPFIALVGIVAIFFVLRRKSVDKRSMYSARRQQIEHKVKAARQRTLAPHGHAEKAAPAPPEAAGAAASPFDQPQVQPTIQYDYQPSARPAPPVTPPTPAAPTQWETPAEPQQMPWEQAPAASTQAPAPAPSTFDFPSAPPPSVEPFKPAAEPTPMPKPSEPVWTPAPRPSEPATPIEQPVAAASTSAGGWSIVTTAKEATITPEPEGKKKKGKQAAVDAGSWALASGEAPGMEAEEPEVKRPSGTVVAMAQYAVLVVGLVMVLIGVLVMVANSHVT